MAVQEPRQPDFFRKAETEPTQVTDRFLKILRATIESPEDGLPEIVPDKDYRGTFLKLTRNLAPTGKTFEQLDIRSAVEGEFISMVPGTRQAVTRVIRKARAGQSKEPEQEEALRGLLRAVHLDQDWLEVTVNDQHIRIDHVGEAVDDVIGPMVNKPVIVQATKDAGGRYHFRDIEADD